MNWINARSELPPEGEVVLVTDAVDMLELSYVYDANEEKREKAIKKERYPRKLEWFTGCCNKIYEEEILFWTSIEMPWNHED